jgi:hypothetical protein
MILSNNDLTLFQSHPNGLDVSRLSDLAIHLNYDEMNTDSEYEIFKYISTNFNPDVWGLISWKFELKTAVNINDFIQFASEQFSGGADCVFINPMIANESIFANVWEQGQTIGHVGIEQLAGFLHSAALIKESPLMSTDTFCMCNYFIGNQKFWREYFKFVDSILLTLEKEVLNHTEVGSIFASSANYLKDSSRTMKPFLVERLFSCFLSGHTSVSAVAFEYTPDNYSKKLGQTLGNFSRNMSRLKSRSLTCGDYESYRLWHGVRSAFIKEKGIPYGLFLHLDDPDLSFADWNYRLSKVL